MNYTVSVNEFIHIAMVVNGSVTIMFVNGIQKYSFGYAPLNNSQLQINRVSTNTV